MSDQKYVYTTYETNVKRQELGDLESVINEYASQGWRVSETIQEGGTTVGFLFEREI